MTQYRSSPTETSASISEVVNITETSYEKQGSTGDESKVDNSSGSILKSPVFIMEVVRQLKRATDPLGKQLDCPCDLMKEFVEATPKRNKENSGLIQGPLRAISHMFIMG